MALLLHTLFSVTVHFPVITTPAELVALFKTFISHKAISFGA